MSFFRTAAATEAAAPSPESMWSQYVGAVERLPKG